MNEKQILDAWHKAQSFKLFLVWFNDQHGEVQTVIFCQREETAREMATAYANDWGYMTPGEYENACVFFDSGKWARVSATHSDGEWVSKA